jgi:hypothetical protein
MGTLLSTAVRNTCNRKEPMERNKRKREGSPTVPSKRVKTQEDSSSEEVLMWFQESWLPDEVLFLICYRLSRSDLLACRLACKQWYKVGQEADLR